MTRIVLLGFSRIAQRRVLPALRATYPHARLCIASRSAPVGARHPDVEWFDDYQPALDAGGDLAYVSLHNSAHAEWTRRALHAGFHVIVDKPAFSSADETLEMTALAARQNRLVSEATVFAYHPQIARLLGEIGGSASPRVTARFSVPAFPSDDFRSTRDLGGGAVEDLGPYAVASSRLLFQEPPDTVCAVPVAIQPDGLITAFSVLFGYRAGGALVGHFGFGTEYRNRLEVLDEHRVIELPRAYTMPPDSPASMLITQRGHLETVDFAPADAFANYLAVVNEAIRRGDWSRLADAMVQDAELLDWVRRVVAA